ncbi:hypothetical protein HOC35_04275 [Candidatus Woesearchaeota archaeon]|jgi:hypothetical protein|nr:hypothetical protein [Candidatus Woesearchaeota archaeon]
MSSVQLYHYPKDSDEYELHEVGNASAWGVGLVCLFAGPTIFGNPSFDIHYNRLQASSEPDWKKIAAGFLLDYTLVLDEHRSQVVDALYRAFDEINDDNINPTIQNVAYKLRELSEGLIVVSTSQISIYGFPDKSVIDPEEFKGNLAQYQDHPLAKDIDGLPQDNGYILAESLVDLIQGKEYPFARSIEELSINHQYSVPTLKNDVLEMFRPALPVPRYVQN